MPDEDRMQTSAFCFESQSIEPAQSAHQHNEDHFFCPEEICLIEVRPARRKNFFFRARKGKLHHPTCHYYKEPQEDTGPGEPHPRPTPDPCTQIPTRLGPPERKRLWKRPTREELLAMVKQANDQPHLVSGTFEEVISAWENLTRAERALNPLMIGDEQLNYQTAFVFLATAEDRVDQLPWCNRILFGAADFKAGKYANIIFVNSVRRLLIDERQLGLNLIIRSEHYPNESDRAYVKDIPLPSRGTMFWRGEAPALSKDKKRLQLQLPDNPRYHGFALRQVILTN